MTDWQIDEYDGQQLIKSYSVPGNLSRGEVAVILKLLYSRHLSPEEIINASLRKRMRGRSSVLDVMFDVGIIQVGENPFLVASAPCAPN